VTGLANLVSLNFEDSDSQRDNQVSNIDLTGLVSLISLRCDWNEISNLDFTGINSITSLRCTFNNITTLDLSNQVNFNLLNCFGNDLFDLNLKNGSIESLVVLGTGNTNLNYICADNEDIAELQEYLDAIGNDNCVLNTYCSFNPGGEFYTINGNVRVDVDENGCDINDYEYQYLKFEVENSNQDLVSVVYSNENGIYELPNPEGSYTITPKPEYPEYFEISPENIAVNFPVDASPLLQDFCLTPIGEKMT
jgi:hypothetical protein